MKSAFEFWEDVDIEEYVDADQDGDMDAKQRIAKRYGMSADEIVRVLVTPYKPTRRRRIMGYFWRWWYRLFPHELER